MKHSLPPFKATIAIIGINPYVLLPDKVLAALFLAAGREKGPIPVRGSIDGQPFLQTLVRYSGDWRLYVNTPMMKATGKGPGDVAVFEVAYDSQARIEPMPVRLQQALNKHPDAKNAFDALAPYLQKEMKRYINQLKTEASIDSNVDKAIRFLLGKGRFIGRDKPA